MPCSRRNDDEKSPRSAAFFVGAVPAALAFSARRFVARIACVDDDDARSRARSRAFTKPAKSCRIFIVRGSMASVLRPISNRHPTSTVRTKTPAAMRAMNELCAWRRCASVTVSSATVSVVAAIGLGASIDGRRARGGAKCGRARSAQRRACDERDTNKVVTRTRTTVTTTTTCYLDDLILIAWRRLHASGGPDVRLDDARESSVDIYS